MSSRLITCVAMAAACLSGVCAGPARSEEPKKVPAEAARTPQQAQAAIQRGLGFLERDALKWRKERRCATCHHGTMTVWALSEAKAQGYAVGTEAFAEIMEWTSGELQEPYNAQDHSSMAGARAPASRHDVSVRR
jgi:uncharacterized protein YfaS (alpha-2-macroglobulin family)